MESPQKLKKIAKVRAVLRALLIESFKDDGELPERRRILLVGMLQGIVWSRGGEASRTLMSMIGEYTDTKDLDEAAERVKRIMSGESYAEVYGKHSATNEFVRDLEKWADRVALRVANSEDLESE